MKFLKLLLIPFLFFTCKSKDCPIPVCAPPSLPYLTMSFDTLFSTDELSVIIITTKEMESEDILSIDTITNLLERDFQLNVIAGQFQNVGIVSISSTLLEDSAYFYELDIPATNHFFIIDQLISQSVYTDHCSCPVYSFNSVEVNDSLVMFGSETVVLKK